MVLLQLSTAIILLTTDFVVQGRHHNAYRSTTCCGVEGESCCGVGWRLHCCDVESSTCCLGDARVNVRPPRLHKHHHFGDWDWDEDWLPLTILAILCVLILSCILMCCCKCNRQPRGLVAHHRLLPDYNYGAIHHSGPTAPADPKPGTGKGAIHSSVLFSQFKESPPPYFSTSGN